MTARNLLRYFTLLGTGLVIMPPASYAIEINLSPAITGIQAQGQAQAQSATGAGLAAIQNAPSQLLDVATAAATSSKTSGTAATGAGGASASSGETSAPSAASAMMPARLPEKPSVEVVGVNKDNSYSSYPEGMGNYNINAHHEDEVLPEQSDYTADESIHDDEITDSPFDGLFLDGSLLYAHTHPQDKQKNNTTGEENTFGVNEDDYTIGVGAGYAFVWGKFYLGTDVYFNFLSYDEGGQNTTINGVATEMAKLKSNGEAGFDLRIGGLLTRRVLLYGSIGIDVAQFKVTSESSSVFDSGENSKTVFGLAPGIGLEYALTKNWFITSQLKYIIFQKINDDYTRPGTTPESINNKYDISRTEFRIGVDYHFD